jgi:DNA polymerase-3 subunit delta
MKINYLQLFIHLEKKLFPVYIIAGDEWWLKQDAVKSIIKIAKKSQFNEYISCTIDKQFNWEEIYHLLYSHSLMGEKRLIHLKLNDTFPNKTGNDLLCEYSKKISQNNNIFNILLIEIGKIESRFSSSKWLSTLEKMGLLVNIWPISRENLPKWIAERAKKKYKLLLSQEISALIAHYTEGNLSAASQFLEKIYLLKIDNINTDIINELAHDESIFNIFDLTDNLIAGNKEKSLHILDRLKKEGVEPVLILWSITRELRILVELATHLSQGTTWANLIEKYRIFSHRQGIIREFLAKYSLHDCLQLLKSTSDIDRIIKGALIGNIWHTLQLFCLKMGI